MTRKRGTIVALVAFMLGMSSLSAEAANCQGRRDTGTAIGAIGGGLVGNAASNGGAGGTIAGAVIGGIAGNVVGGNGCRERYAEPRRNYRDSREYRRAPPRYYREARRRAYYVDRYGYRHYR